MGVRAASEINPERGQTGNISLAIPGTGNASAFAHRMFPSIVAFALRI